MRIRKRGYVVDSARAMKCRYYLQAQSWRSDLKVLWQNVIAVALKLSYA